MERADQQILSIASDDKALFNRISAGEETAFRLLFERYKSRFYGAAFKMTHSETIAEEIVQDVFMTIWLRRHTLPAIENPTSYLFTMVYHAVYSQLKKIALDRKATSRAKPLQPGEGDEPESWLEAREARALIAQAVDQLTPQQQKVYRLSREAGMSRDQIAAELGISPNTVKNHLQDALDSIRDYLQHAGGLGILLILFHS